MIAVNIRCAAILAFAVLLLPLIAACQPKEHHLRQANGQPGIEILYSSQQCGRSQASPSATWIDNTRQLETRVTQIRSTLLGGKPLALPEPDFQHEIALLVEMGQQPTAGYRIALTGVGDLHITHDKAHLALDWIHPPDGAIVAQITSSPCLLLKLERGNYTSVQVLNRQGNIKTGTH